MAFSATTLNILGKTLGSNAPAIIASVDHPHEIFLPTQQVKGKSSVKFTEDQN